MGKPREAKGAGKPTQSVAERLLILRVLQTLHEKLKCRRHPRPAPVAQVEILTGLFDQHHHNCELYTR